MIDVMIVEDDPMVMDIICQYVKSINGFNVKATASNGSLAMEKLKFIKVDLLILDVYMPIINGIDLLTEIRKSGNLVDALFLTAADDIQMIDKAFKFGAVDYLIKPFRYERFKNTLDVYKNRFQAFHVSEKLMTQQDIDKAIGRSATDMDMNIPRGLNKRTLQHIRNYIGSSEEKTIVSEEISNDLGISVVTVRKYMEYLTNINEVVLKLEYGTVGRPTYKYCKLSEN